MGFSLVVAIVAWLALACGNAGAATVSPTTALDNDAAVGSDCTLREAVQSINAASDQTGCAHTGTYGTSDTVALVAGTIYTLSVIGPGEDNNATGDLDAFSDITITGAAATRPTIQNNADDRVLEAVNDTDMTLKDLIVTGGQVMTGSGGAQKGGNLNQ